MIISHAIIVKTAFGANMFMHLEVGIWVIYLLVERSVGLGNFKKTNLCQISADKINLALFISLLTLITFCYFDCDIGTAAISHTYEELWIFYVSCRQHWVAVAQQISPETSSSIIHELMWSLMSLARIKIVGLLWTHIYHCQASLWSSHFICCVFGTYFGRNRFVYTYAVWTSIRLFVCRHEG